MPAHRKLIKASKVAEMLGWLNPFSKRPTWMFEEKEVQELKKLRESLGK